MLLKRAMHVCPHSYLATETVYDLSMNNMLTEILGLTCIALAIYPAAFR